MRTWESGVKDVYYTTCCGSWCVWMVPIFGKEIRVLTIDMAETDKENKKLGEQAKKYADALRKLLVL